MTEHFLESLEQRIAPATLVDAKTVQFHDAEGDLIQVSISKGEFTETDFTFTTGSFGDTGPQTLASLNLDSVFAGTNLTISVLETGTGEGSGKAQIGGIEATGVKLGTVSIAGDLGFIDAGDGKAGIKSLTVDSLGMLTPADYGQDDRTSDVAGAISTLTIHGDFGGTLNVTGGKKGTIGKAFIDGSLVSGAGDIAGYIHTTGAIKSVNVTGSIDGSDANAANEAGIVSDLGIKSVLVGGSIEGGGFKNTGVIIAGLTDTATGTILKGTTKISTVSVTGDIVGGAGKFSGAVISWAGFGTVTVNGDLTGGTGEDSGTIQAGGIISGVPTHDPKPENPQTRDEIIGGNISKVFIGGDVTGDDGLRSASILAWGAGDNKFVGGVFGEANIGGSITGGDGTFSALVYGYAGLKKATVGVDLIGGKGADSGRIATDAGPLGVIFVGRDVKGGDGVESGTIYAGSGGTAGSRGNITSVEIGGDLIGGLEMNSGSVQANGNLGTVIVNGSLIGKGAPPDPAIANDRGGSESGFISAGGDVKLVHIGLDILGGQGLNTGVISVGGNVGAVEVGGEIKGGTYAQSGTIFIDGSVKEISVVESVTGTDYSYTGFIQALRGAGSISIGGDLVGGDSIDATKATSGTYNSGAIAVGGISQDGYLVYGSVKTISIGGSIIAGEIQQGVLQNSGAIRVNGGLGTLDVGESLIGNEDMSVIITGLVNTSSSVGNNVAIKSVNVGKDVDHALILAGFINAGQSSFYSAAPFARIGSVTVGEDWIASSLAAGVDPGAHGYGDGDTQMANYYEDLFPKFGLSKIDSVTIGGHVEGGADGDQYGFAAQSFGKISINGQLQQIPAVDSTTNLTENGSVKIHTVKKAS